MKKLITLLLLATGVASGITVTIDNVVAAHQDLPQSEAYTGRLGELVFNMGKDPANNATNIHNGFITMYNGINDGGRAIQPGLDPATHIFVSAEYSSGSSGDAGALANGVNLKNAIAYAKSLRKTLSEDSNYRNDIIVYVPSGYYVVPEPLDVRDTSIRIIGTASSYITGKKRGVNQLGNAYQSYALDNTSPGTLISLAPTYTGTHTGAIFLAGDPSAAQTRLTLENIHVFGNIKAFGSTAGYFQAHGCILEGDIYNEAINLQAVVLKNTGFYGQGLRQIQTGLVEGCIFVSDGAETFLSDVHNMAFIDCYFECAAGVTLNMPIQHLYFYDCFWDTTCTDWFSGAPGFGGGGIEFHRCELAGANAANWFDDRIAAASSINNNIKLFYCTELPTEIATLAEFLIKYCVDENDANVADL